MATPGAESAVYDCLVFVVNNNSLYLLYNVHSGCPTREVKCSFPKSRLVPSAKLTSKLR